MMRPFIRAAGQAGMIVPLAVAGAWWSNAHMAAGAARVLAADCRRLLAGIPGRGPGQAAVASSCPAAQKAGWDIHTRARREAQPGPYLDRAG